MAFIKREIVSNGHGALSPVYFAIHSTANVGATARNHVNYWRGQGKKYAVHYVVDWNEAYQCVEEDRLCYQVGNGNRTCIGIEICEGRNEDEFMRSIENARKAILEVLNRRGWGTDRLRSHKWFTENYGGSDHTDPIPYLKRYGKTWEWFVDYVSKGEATPTEQEDDMGLQCIIQPNEESFLGYYDGVNFHPAANPDEIGALQQVAVSVTGKQLPMIKLGTKDAPWGTRFLNLIQRVADIREQM